MRHTFVALVEDIPGVLNRVVSVFRRRQFNIESLTVSHTHQPGISRITIVTSGTPMVIEQIKNQLGRLVPVHKVRDLTVTGPYVQRGAKPQTMPVRQEKRIHLAVLRLGAKHDATNPVNAVLFPFIQSHPKGVLK